MTMVTQTGGAPAALQPDDIEAQSDYEAFEQWAASSKPKPYSGPLMDSGAQARAGLWLNEKVMHDASHTFGVIVGRAVSGDWWVELDLTGRGAKRLLIDARALTLATPELEAVIEAERARQQAAMELAAENKRRFTRHVPSLRAAREPGTPSRKGVYPEDHDGLRFCGRCREWLPVEEFRKEQGHGPRRVCKVCERKDGHRARNGARNPLPMRGQKLDAGRL
jgi:hypothetical protein